MKNKLLVLGDSYCASSLGWPLHLAKMLNSDLTCFGEGGQPWYSVKQWMDNNPGVVETANYIVFAHTNAERIPTDNNQIGIVDHSKTPESELEHAIALYYKYIHSVGLLHYIQKLWFEDLNRITKDKLVVHLHCFSGHTIDNSHLLEGINVFPDLTSISMREKAVVGKTLFADNRLNHFSLHNNQALAKEIYTAIKIAPAVYKMDLNNFELTQD